MRKENVCLTSTIKAELIACKERDSHALAWRKAMDSVAEKHGTFHQEDPVWGLLLLL